MLPLFNEANSVEEYVRDLLAGRQTSMSALQSTTIHDAKAPYGRDSAALVATGLGWRFVPGNVLPRQQTDVLVEGWLREALIRLNPEIAEQPDRADEVLYKLRAIVLSVHGNGLVSANEEFTAWLRGERSMPFGPNHQHVPVQLIDFDHPEQNDCIVSTQVTYRTPEKRFDLVLYVNGIPLVVGEAKTPVRPAVSWVDGAADISDDYEKSVPAFFVPNVFSFATDGRAYRFGSVRMPLEIWAPWREGEDMVAMGEIGGLLEIRSAVRGMLRPAVMLDILQNFTLFATDKKHRKIKLICRYQQYFAANQIVERVAAGQIKKGLI